MDLMKHREAAQRAQERYREQVAAVRDDKDLSDEGRQRRLAEIYRTTQRKLDDLATDERTALDGRWTSLTSQLYGADRFGTDPASHAISMRDAADRVAQLSTPQQAARLMRDAEANGDRVLAKAIFRHVSERESSGSRGADDAWNAIGRDYVTRHGEVERVVNELAQIEDMGKREVFSPFTAQRPHDVAPQFLNTTLTDQTASA